MALTNSQIPGIALRGGSGENGRGSFWTEPGTIYSAGWHASAVYYRLKAMEREGYKIVHAIYSYRTPILIEVEAPSGERVWLRWDVTYSATTGSRHLSQCWRIPSKWLPWDASVEDMIGVIEGYTVYVPPRKRDGIGSFRRGPVDRPSVRRKNGSA